MLKIANDFVQIDYLTGLANRYALSKYYDSLDINSTVHTMFIDIDNFKRVNDLYGHSMGDELLVSISKLIKKCVVGYSARIGGDEFVALINGNISEEKIIEIARKLVESIKVMDFRKDVLSHISLSVGVVMHQKVKEPLDDVLHKCDIAMYQAKYDGKNRYVIYHEYDDVLLRNKNIELEMNSALEEGQFKIFLQPKINVVTSKLSGAEALSRWEHPVDGLRMPGVYIPLFEKNGFISKLDMNMFEEVCKLKELWKQRNDAYAEIPISVNTSRLHLYDEGFADKLESIADKYGIPHNELEIEITEGIFVKDQKELINSIEKVKEKGFLVSIDDFGSGFSSLNILKDLKVHTIKIDREFLNEIATTSQGKTIVKSIISMCLDLKMDVVTEGVETKEQVDFITRCGCQVAQGYYYSKPLCISDFEKFADEYMVPVLNSYTFHLNGDLKSEDGSMEGEYVGNNIIYQEGIYEDTKSVYFPGGPIGENLINIPPEVLVNDSYTISLWINPEKLHEWVCSLYIRFEVGFAAILPLAWEGHSSFRIRDSKGPIGWYDVPNCRLAENKWTHITCVYNAKTETAIIFMNGEPIEQVEEVPTNRYVKQIMLGGDVFQPSFRGHMCELVIYNEAKDYEFVKNMFNSYVEREGFTKDFSNM